MVLSEEVIEEVSAAACFRVTTFATGVVNSLVMAPDTKPTPSSSTAGNVLESPLAATLRCRK